VKLGGHAFPLKLEPEALSSFVKTFRKFRASGHELVVVAGGGAAARSYINAARGLGANEAVCDQLGIDVARLNAELLVAGLGEDAYPVVPACLDEFRVAFESGKIVILGGLLPEQSTDAVAALLSELVGADIMVKATDTDGVFTADPKRHPKAKKLEKVSYGELRKLVSGKSVKAGGYKLLDPVALRILERSETRLRVVDGREPRNIERAVKGEKVGTLVT
jgi:uridylate kinase